MWALTLDGISTMTKEKNMTY